MSQAVRSRVVSPELFVAVNQFYARQMPLLDARRFEEFLETFTEDAVLEHRPNGWKLEGKAVILAEMQERRGDPQKPLSGDISPRDARSQGVAYYDGLVYHYWYDQILITPQDDDSVHVGYQAVVSMTDETGRVTFEPTTRVDDVLVMENGELRTQRRTVTHDTPRWADRIHNPS